MACSKPVTKTQEVIVAQHDANKINVPIGGNSWTYNGGVINNTGLSNWNSSSTSINTYVLIPADGTLKISLLMNPGGQSTIAVKIQGESKEISIQGTVEKEYFVGEWKNIKKDYLAIELRGINKSDIHYGEMSSIALSGSALIGGPAYVKDNIDNYFYWGRRGPSVHLNYTVPANANITAFYSEITVPIGNDVQGSYFMANGFGEGYFGIQVNSATERRVLFSVWSPYVTDNPANIPPEYKISMLKKGSSVYTGEFGNEGAGGQSYLVYPWKTGNKYRFLLLGNPQQDNSTIYTAYFFAPEENKWLLIASFKRPKTNTYLKSLYSFLENFLPETGNQTRMALFGNQWVMNDQGTWFVLNMAKFTADQTARKDFRRDYSGGTEGAAFFLKNCGFFTPNTAIDTQLTKTGSLQPPVIDFTNLP
jgi:hypothetical protein